MHRRRVFDIDMRRFVAFLLYLLAASAASAHGTIQYVNGKWFDGSQFVSREFWSIEGVLHSTCERPADIVVDLRGGYVLPAYGNAHTHAIGNDDFEGESRRLLQRGVVYVANPNSIRSTSAPAREKTKSGETVEARFANGGLTSSGGHPIQIFESAPGKSEWLGEAYHVVDDENQLAKVWPEVLAGDPDFLKIYLESSEHHDVRKDDPAYYGKRGLDPDLVAPIVERANAAGLQVAAHVTTRRDFRVAVDAGVHEIAHLPLQALTEDDVSAAARRGVTIVTTTLSHRPAPDVEDLDRLHAANLALLKSAGVRVVLGTDSQATVVDELLKVSTFGVFDDQELLRMLVHDTPRWIFPAREIGELKEGAESTFVVLEQDPLDDLRVLRTVSLVVNRGHQLEFDSSDDDAIPGIGQQLVGTLMSSGVESAIAEYERLRSQEPDAWDFGEGQLEALADALVRHGKAADAIAILELNCRQFPDSAGTRVSLARALLEAGERSRAATLLREALELDADDEDALALAQELEGS